MACDVAAEDMPWWEFQLGEISLSKFKWAAAMH